MVKGYVVVALLAPSSIRSSLTSYKYVVVTTRPDAAPQGPDDPAALLISEILKQQKQLIINGRDYIETLSDQRNVREADDRLNGDFAQNTGVESINDFSRQPMESLCLQ